LVGYEENIVFDTYDFNGTPRKWLDVSKINKMGWEANVSLSAGLTSVYEYNKKRSLVAESRRFCRLKVAIIFTLGLLSAGNGVAQGLSGSNGLFNIPVAYLPDDRQMTIGAHFLNKNYGSFKYGRDKDYQWHGLATFVNLTFLPRLEFQFRYTQLLGREISADSRYFPDRMLTVRFQILKDSTYLPALTLGLQDQTYLFDGDFSHFATNYMVASKTVKWSAFECHNHLGVGLPLLKEQHRPTQFRYNGFFGGIGLRWSRLPGLEVMVEHDSSNFNVGMKMLFYKRLQLLVGLHESKGFSGGFSWRTNL
jgi:hypothetical protein